MRELDLGQSEEVDPDLEFSKNQIEEFFQSIDLVEMFAYQRRFADMILMDCCIPKKREKERVSLGERDLDL
jgi:hypothetical protein